MFLSVNDNLIFRSHPCMHLVSHCSSLNSSLHSRSFLPTCLSDAWIPLRDFPDAIGVFNGQLVGSAPVRDLEGSMVVTEAGA
jgi:hypothetical protein